MVVPTRGLGLTTVAWVGGLIWWPGGFYHVGENSAALGGLRVYRGLWPWGGGFQQKIGDGGLRSGAIAMVERRVTVVGNTWFGGHGTVGGLHSRLA